MTIPRKCRCIAILCLANESRMWSACWFVFDNPVVYIAVHIIIIVYNSTTVASIAEYSILNILTSDYTYGLRIFVQFDIPIISLDQIVVHIVIADPFPGG